jgi:hypothetical protein
MRSPKELGMSFLIYRLAKNRRIESGSKQSFVQNITLRRYRETGTRGDPIADTEDESTGKP